MGNYSSRNIGSKIKTAASGSGSLTAAGAGDAAEVTGAGFDRMAAGGGGFLSAVLAVWAKAVQAGATTLKMTVKIEHADDSGFSVNLTSVTLSAAAPGDTIVTGAGTKEGTLEYDVNLSSLRRYVRLKVTPDLSAAGVDTATWAAGFIMGGADQLPV